MKIKRLATTLGVVAILVISSPGVALAYTDPGTNDPEDLTTWNQNDVSKWGGHALAWGKDGTNGLSAAGCAQFSLTAISVKSGKMPKGYTVLDWREDTLRIKNEGGAAALNGGGLFSHDMSWITTLTDGFLEPAGKLMGSFSAEDIKREVWDKGYLAMMGVFGDGHWVAFDYIDDDGTIHLMDSGYRGTTIPGETYGPDSRVTTIWLFKTTDGTHVKDLPTFDGGTIGSTSGSDGDEEGENSNSEDFIPGKGKFGLVPEGELTGIIPATKGENEQGIVGQEKIADAAYKAHLASLEYNQQENVRYLSQYTQDDKKWDAARIASTTSAFTGILLILYSSLFIIAFAADSVMFTNSKFTKMMTFNKYGQKVRGEEVKESEGTLHIAWPRAITLGIAMAAVGGMLVSGTFVKWVQDLLLAVIGVF